MIHDVYIYNKVWHSWAKLEIADSLFLVLPLFVTRKGQDFRGYYANDDYIERIRS